MKEAKDEKKLRKEWGEYSAKEYKNLEEFFFDKKLEFSKLKDPIEIKEEFLSEKNV